MPENSSVTSAPVDPREERIRSIVIVGGGSAGWMAASYLVTALSRDIKISLVESDAIGIVGVGEATIPPIKKFNRSVQLDEQEFLKATQGTFKVGIEFHDWGALGDRYIHQFGYVGREMDAIVKLHHWWRVGQLADTPDYPQWQDVFVAKAAARANRFALPDRRPGSPLSRFAYAYHFDAHLYGQFLRNLSEKRGVKRIEGRIIGAEHRNDGRGIAAVKLENGQSVEGDLFIDCSGFRSLLLGGELKEPFDDWSRWLPADRALAVPSAPHPDHIRPYTQAVAHTVGWQWRIPLQNRVGNGHVFSSAFSSENDAEQRLLETLETPANDTPRLIKFKTGHRNRAWVQNVVALGLSAGFLEPLESTSIHLVQSSLERLIELFPTRRMDSKLRDRFNAQTSAEWTRIRDFVIAHYKVTQRTDSEFWRHMGAIEVPDTLTEILELWKERGILAADPGHLFQLGSWSSVLIGQGLVPERVHALADRANPVDVDKDIRTIVAEVERAAVQLPPHSDFLQRYCPASS